MNIIHSQNQMLRAYIGMAMSTLIIGLSFVFVKIALRSAGPFDVLAHRFNAAVIALLLLYVTGIVKKPKLNRKQFLQLLSISVFYPLLFFGLQTVGLQYTTASEAGIMSAITPVMTLLLASLLLKERHTIGQIMGVVLSVAGIGYIFMKSGTIIHGNSIRGNFIILLSVFSIVFYYIFGRKINKHYRTIDITFVMIVLAAIVFNVIAIGNHLAHGTMHEFITPLSHSSFILAILYLGVLSSMVTSVFNNYALVYIPASQVAVINNLTPLISIMGGIMILDEQLHLFHFIGAAMVILGVLGTTFFQHRNS